MSEATASVCGKLTDVERLKKGRVHPIGILAAFLTYRSGKGGRGKLTWDPVAAVIDALDSAFYTSFGAVTPTKKRTLLALDVSGSMGWAHGMFGGGGGLMDIPGLTPRVASSAMALVTAAVEPMYGIVGFSHQMVTVPISPRQRLDDVLHTVDNIPMGGTDCALPMIWARKNHVDVDTFVTYTDNETWAGAIHPFQALKEYRQKRGINSKLVTVGMTATGFSIADPTDAGMLDVVGFDTGTPNVISQFATE
jgi:60 kDa SS-A/Ro ribonucleoprotein